MKDTKIPEQKCPYCGFKMDGTTSAFGDCDATPGAMSICYECTKVSIFDDNLMMRLPTEEEEFIILTFPAVKRAQEGIRYVKNKLKKKPHHS